MKRLLLIILSTLLTSCAFIHVHKMDIEQGNIISADRVNRLHVGMSVEQIKDIMGPPVLENVFDRSRIDYVYTFKPGYGNTAIKYVTLILRNGRLSEIKGNMYSQFLR